MMWLVTLLVLAIIAYFVVKSVSSNIRKKEAGSNSSVPDAIEHASAQQRTLEVSDSANTTSTSPGSKAGSPAGAAAVAAGAAVAGAVTSAVAGTSANVSPPSSASGGLNTGDTLSDVREMIKILNLDAPDAGRLAIDREQLVALRKGEASGIPDTAILEDVAAKLRNMLS